jgi:hypothetical protein
MRLVSRSRSSQPLAATSGANFGIERTLANFMIVVPLLNPKFATEFPANAVRTSGSRHYGARFVRTQASSPVQAAIRPW